MPAQNWLRISCHLRIKDSEGSLKRDWQKLLQPRTEAHWSQNVLSGWCLDILNRLCGCMCWPFHLQRDSNRLDMFIVLAFQVIVFHWWKCYVFSFFIPAIKFPQSGNPALTCPASNSKQWLIQKVSLWWVQHKPPGSEATRELHEVGYNWQM